MIGFTLKLIGALATLIGPFVGIAYYIRVAYRQEKSILVLFVQELILLFQRCTMYYAQILKGAQSYSTLFQISDASLFGKLSDVVKNPSIIEKTLELKAEFFQVIRYADKAWEVMAKASIATDDESKKQYKEAARHFQSLAVVFFVGDLIPDEGIFRNNIDRPIEKLTFIIDYLESVNSRPAFLGRFSKVFPNLYYEINATASFIKKTRSELTQLREMLYLLREKERLLIKAR